nr:hypothetical protein [Tanacetum cinerariifolium]
MAISVSSDSSEDKVGTPAGRVILFGTIPTTIPDITPVITPPTTQTDTTFIPTETPIITPTIPPSPDYTPTSPDYSPASDIYSDPSEDPSSGYIPPLLARSPVIPRRRVMILAPGQPIPHGRPYRYHPNGPIHMMTARKRVVPLPVQQLAVRYSVNHSSSNSSSRHSLSDHSFPDLPSTFAGSSCKRRRSPMTSVPALPPVSRALSPVRADLIPSPKRVRDIGYLADVEVSPRETRVERVTHPAMPEDIPEPTQEGAVQVIEGVQREQGHRIVGVESAFTALTERVAELERDNRRLRGTASVESQRVDRLQRSMSPEEMEACKAVRNLETLNENEDDQEGENGGDENRGNGGNGNGDNRGNKGNRNGGNRGNGNRGNEGNGIHGMNYGGTEGVVGLIRWFEKMDSALTWWNSHKRTIGVDATNTMKWVGLRKLMTEVYCLRNEIQKMETELRNLTVKGNDMTSYTQRFQELILLCTRMVPNEEDRVERFTGGLLDNIQGNVISANPARLQDAIRITNPLMDKKLQGYAARSAENKRRMESNPRNNRRQQPSFKRQNTTRQNVAKAYTAGNNERKGYVRSFPYRKKCRLHHEGLCTIRCGNCKKTGHQTRDCRVTVIPNTQGATVGNQQGIVCYECGRPGHFKKDCPKLRNQHRGNQTRNKTGGNEVTAKAYAIGEGGTNPDSNVVTCLINSKGQESTQRST